MHNASPTCGIDPEKIERAIRRAVRAVPPAWPLASSVAVNPFLGQAGENLAETAARLTRVGGIAVTMPRSWYAERIAAGAISDKDLHDAYMSAPAPMKPVDLVALKSAAFLDAPIPAALPTVADLAAKASGTDWPSLVAERFGAWAAGYFDAGQALGAAPRGKSAYAAWRAVAMHDLTPEILGLPGFALHVAEAPDSAGAAIARVVERLGLSEAALETYFHQMLTTLGGWAQYARYGLWQAELGGGSDGTITDFLTIRLVWEEALFIRHEPQVAAQWARARGEHAAPIEPTPDLVIDCILQDAAERSAQRALAETLATASPPSPGGRPPLAAPVCRDGRSEGFSPRRASRPAARQYPSRARSHAGFTPSACKSPLD